MKRLGVALLGLLVCGCTFRAPQLDALVAMFRTGSGVGEELAASAWTLDWLGERSVVYPVVVESDVVFSNASEVLIVFDGWQITRVIGLLPAGREVAIEMDGHAGPAAFVEDRVEVARVDCTDWSDRGAEAGARVLLQRCGDLASSNRIVLDAESRVVELEFVFHPGYPPIVLRRGLPDAKR